MSSPFLSSGFDTSALTDGSIQIFASNLGATDLQPGFPCKVNNDQQIESTNLEISDVNGLQAALTSIITNPFNGTLEVINLVTAYDSTPVDLNNFVAATLNDLSDLKSNTQYITSSLGQTQISSNILTNDVDASSFRSQDGSIFIDMTTPGDVNVSATNFLFNGDPVLTSATGAFLKLDGSTTMTGDIDLGGNDIINTASIQPVSDGTQDIGTFLNSYKDIYLDGEIKGSVKSNSVNSLVSGPVSSTINNIASFNNATGDIKDSTVSISSVSGGPFLPLSGGTLSGTLDMSSQTLTVNNMSDSGAAGMHWGSGSSASNIDALVIGRGSSTSTDSVVIGRNSGSAGVYGVVLGVNSSSVNNTAGNVAIGAFCNSSGDPTPFSGGGGAISIGFTVDASNKEAIAIGSGLNNSTASSLLIGGTVPMVNWRTLNDNTCDLGTSGTSFKDIYAKGSITGAINTRTVDNIVSNSGTGAANNICSFVSNKVIQDSGASISTASSSLNLGLTNTISGSGSITVGASNTAGGFAGGKSIIYGNNNNTSGSVNGQCIIYGNDNTDSNGAGGSFIYGFGNTNGTGQRNILIGRNNAVPNGVSEAFAMGFAVTNSISNSLVVGGTSQANIRAGSNNVCTLGLLTTNEFKTAFTRNVDTSAALAIAPTSATSLALGRAGITTTVLGSAVLPAQYGAYYGTASYNIAFTAGVGRLIPPTVSSNGPQVDFSFAAGVLTYTGSQAFRVCKINYNINLNLPAAGNTLTFFNSKNGATAISAIQSVAVIATNAQYNNVRATVQLSDHVVLSNGNTVQLACQSTNLIASVTFDFVSCNISTLLN